MMDLEQLIQKLIQIHEEHGNQKLLYVDAADLTEGQIDDVVYDDSDGAAVSFSLEALSS